MIRKAIALFYVVLLSLSGAGHAAVAVTAVDFTQDTAAKLFEQMPKQMPEISEGLLSLPDRISTRTISVQAGKRYELQIKAKVDSDFVVEKYGCAHIFTLQSFRYGAASTYSVIFENAQGERISDDNGAATLGTIGFFLAENLTQYTTAFDAPANAASLKVSFRSHGQKTQIASLQLFEVTDVESLNLTPDFRYGELSYAGWSHTRDGRFYARTDGKTVLNPGYGGSSSYFPINDRHTYRFFARGKEGHFVIYYYNAEGKTVSKKFLLRPKEDGAAIEVIPPKGTVRGRVVIYGVDNLEEFKVTLVK